MQSQGEEHILSESDSLSEGPEERTGMCTGRREEFIVLELRIYLKGQRTPAHRRWIDFCRL